MDRKMPILKSKKWLIAAACVLALSMLTVAVCTLSQFDDGQAVFVPSTPAATSAAPSVPPTIPVELPQPTEPEEAWGQTGVITQSVLSKPPVSPVLELNPFKRNDFGKSKGYITCKTEEYWLGVDVSFWQEEIDWVKVEAAGFKFAMVRLGYRGWSKVGKLQIDPRGQENLDGAAAAGLKVGVYFFSQATNAQEAIEEAQYVLELLDGRELDMPIVFDWEVPTEATYVRTRYVKAKTMQACAMAFCQVIKEAGYQPMVYFSQWQGSHQYDLAELRAAGVELWVAMYTRALTYSYKVQMWQYTGEGRVPGIKTKVDIDMYFPNH